MLTIHDIIIHEYAKEKRKTLSIRVAPSGVVTLKAPLEASDVEVHDFVGRKKGWVREQLTYFAQFKDIEEKPLSSGQSILYLGRQYQLIVRDVENKEGVKLEKNTLVLYSAKQNNARHNKRLLDRWMLTKAEHVFHERLSQVMQNFLNLARPVLKIRKYKGRWGSYKNHTMTLNPMLIQAAKSAIDYIITHELCHYYHKNHDDAFYSLLTAKMPNWKDAQNKLEQRVLGV